MLVGIGARQGYQGEYEGEDPALAFETLVRWAQECDELGFDSFWVYDHLLPANSPEDRFMLESFISAAALSRETKRIGIGHLVACAPFRNPGLTAKMASTLDAASGGRYELGIGAGWKADEWRAFGYEFGLPSDRLRHLEESLEIISALIGDGTSTFFGRAVRADRALNEPRGVRKPRLPLIVGGNGRKVTWRLAARFADELNVDAIPPSELERALPTLHQHCADLGRDPADLKVSVHVWGSKPPRNTPDLVAFRNKFQLLPGERNERIDLFRRYEALGVSRLQVRFDDEDGRLADFAEDCVRAGVVLR